MTASAHHATLDAVAATLGLPPGAPFRPLGQGTDHQAFAVGDLVVRIDVGDDAGRPGRIAREADLLAAVATVSPLTVPEVVASRPDLGAIVVRRLSGVSALDRPPRDAAAVAEQLAGFVAALASVDHAALCGLVDVDDAPPEEYLAELVPLAHTVGAELTVSQRQALQAFLATVPPPSPEIAVFCHHDLGAEHILLGEDGRTITGVIDWSDAAVADPAHDLGRILRDLGAAAAVACRDALGLDDERLSERIVFHARCALIEDLAHGIEHGDRRYADAALAALDRVFAPDPLG